LSQILKSWTWQLLQQKPHLVDPIYEIYLETFGVTTPLTSYQKALEYLLSHGSVCYLILDGLDESTQESAALLGIMSSVMNLAKVLVSTRWESWIEVGMSIKSIILSIQPGNTAPDIEQWIRAEVGIKGYEKDIAEY
jgi:hypothetical protein